MIFKNVHILYLILLFIFNFILIRDVKSQQQLTPHISDSGIKYLTFLPKDYSDSKDSLPVLLFLHGLGERGNNLDIVKRYGPPEIISNGKWPEDFPFIVISPQLPIKYEYWSVNFIDDILNHVLSSYRVDQKRIYLTGLSLGGIGTWNYAIKKPERIAAIIPVCGKGDSRFACNLKNLPVWAFHGDQDGIVKPQGSIKMIEALNNCNDRKADITRFTLYPGVKHDSWTRTYNNFEIYRWLLQFENANSINSLSTNSSLENNEPKSTTSLNLKNVCTLPVALKESSGLQTFSNNFIWTHNDSGSLPVIYQIDTTGKINQFKTITNAANFDWEDLAKDDNGNLYIGDFGNNNNNRKSLQIYKISNPETTPDSRIKAEVIQFTYSDQTSFPPSPSNMNYDVEAMLIYKENIYLFSKNNTKPYSGYVKLYKLPLIPGEYKAELLDSLFLGDTNMLENSITGADISPDNSNIALLTYNKIWLLNGFEGDRFFKGSIIPIQLSTLTQKEGITFKNNTEIYISDERFQNIIGGKLYQLDLSSFLLN